MVTCCSRVLWFAVALVVITGCHVRAGLDATSRADGPLHTLMSQSTVSREDGVVNLPPTSRRNYGIEAGFGNRTITVNGLLAMHDVASTSFTPGAGFLATTLGVNARWQLLTWRKLSPTIAGGPARMLLLDRSSGERVWGNALRVAAGAQYQLGPIALYGDIYHEVVAFSSGPASGTTSLDGVTFGLAIQP